MQKHKWVDEFPGAVTVCDPDGVILEMNDRASRMFSEQGGAALVGANLFDCHVEPALAKLKRVMEQKCPNVYTIEKKGIKKIIHQTPWYIDGNYSGFVEIVMDLPEAVPHFIRD